MRRHYFIESRVLILGFYEDLFGTVKRKSRRKVKDQIPGGKSDSMSWEDLLKFIQKDHPEYTLNDLMHEKIEGHKVEMEHTSDISIADEIAKDHIREYPWYYSRLLVPAEKKLGL